MGGGAVAAAGQDGGGRGGTGPGPAGGGGPAGVTRPGGGARPGGGPRTRRAVVRRLPVRRLTVLYDPQCRLCAFAASWLSRQRQLVPLDLVPSASAEARRRFPALDHAATGKDVTVIGDAGQVYRGDAAWVVCLWALADHRAFSHTLTTPAGRRLARAAVLSAAKYRASARHSTGPTPAAPAHRPDKTYAVTPGWTYDRVNGWTAVPPPKDRSPRGPSPGWTYEGDGHWAQADGDACADGCAADPD